MSIVATIGNAFTINSAGAINKPLQPCFSYYLGSTVTNATGNGAAWQLGSGTALTKLYDQSNSFNSNGTFTCPMTGYYFFSITMQAGNITALMTDAQLDVITTQHTYTSGHCNPGVAHGNSNNYSFRSCPMVYMTTGDTAVAKLTITGGLSNTASVIGSSTIGTWFSGYLVC